MWGCGCMGHEACVDIDGNVEQKEGKGRVGQGYRADRVCIDHK
jgi:hypothetical protein